MATQAVRFTGRTGLTLTADVLVDSTGASFATGVTVNGSNGVYTFDLTDSAGVYRVQIKRAGDVIDNHFVKTTNTAATFDTVIERASIARADTLAEVLADTSELQTNQGDWATADVSLLALEATAQSILTDTAVLPASFPTNFASMLINGSGHVSRVTLVDTTTTNTDMRGTDGANTATPLDAAGTRAAVGMASANLDTQLAGKALETTAQTIVTQTGAAAIRTAIGIASANVDTQLAAIQSKGNDIETDTQNIQGRIPAALVSGRIDATVGAYQTGLAPLDDAGVAEAVWDALPADHEVNGSYGEVVLIAQGSQRAVSVDNNHRVHAAVYEMQSNVIDGNSLASSAIVAMGSYQIPQTVPAVGVAATRDQALGMLIARGTKSAIVGTTETIYAADGTTPLYTLTLTNDGEYTTAIARAS